MDGTPVELFENGHLLSLITPTLRADIALCEKYRYHVEPKLNVSISAFAGIQDAIPIEDIAAWEEETSSTFRLQSFEGGHFFVQNEQEKFLNALRAELDAMTHMTVTTTRSPSSTG
jgi:surfactin synthase thioesterase subunit